MSDHPAGADNPGAAPSTAGPAEPATNLLAGSGDRCVNCGATLALDQRYCVECGTRRGNPRFAIATTPEAAPSASPDPRASAGWSRLSAALAVIAVLLALGVGVLIGQANQSAIKQPVKIELTGGSLSSIQSTGTTPASGNTSGASGNKNKANGGSGSSCTKGTAGCKNGKQTGNFFGS